MIRQKSKSLPRDQIINVALELKRRRLRANTKFFGPVVQASKELEVEDSNREPSSRATEVSSSRRKSSGRPGIWWSGRVSAACAGSRTTFWRTSADMAGTTRVKPLPGSSCERLVLLSPLYLFLLAIAAPLYPRAGVRSSSAHPGVIGRAPRVVFFVGSSSHKFRI